MPCLGALLPGVTNRREAAAGQISGAPVGKEAEHSRPGLPMDSVQRPTLLGAVLPIKGRSEVAGPQHEPDHDVEMVTTPLRRCSRRRRRLHSNASTKSLPKWALPSSPHYQMDDSPVSVASSVTTVTGASLYSKSISKVSKSSFKWTPEALVQSWHGKLSELYNIVNIVGEGRSGTVFIVEHKSNGKCYACKLLLKNDHDPVTLRSEIQTLRRLDHRNIVRLYETHEDGETVFLLMELCSGGDLLDNISEAGSLSEPVARNFAQQMLSALAYCHANGVAHRDVKPDNFLLETADSDCMTLKLADFGVATSIRPEHLGASPTRSGAERRPGRHQEVAFGSLPYMAPETLSDSWRSAERAGAAADLATLTAPDLWSCGVAIYAMLSGRLPFGESPDVICSGKPPDFSGSPWDNITQEAIHLVRSLLNPNPRERLTAQQALAHNWFQETPQIHKNPEQSTPGSQTPETLADNIREIALVVLRSMRQWRQMPKLRRIAIAAVAKRLEGQSDAQRLAEGAYMLFSGTSEKLRCDQLLHALYGALCETMTPETAREMGSNLAWLPSPAPSFASSAVPTPPSPDGVSVGRLRASITGLHVRQRVRRALQRLAGSTRSGFGLSNPSGNITSLEELRHLVAALDGMKNGTVDYTLFVACMLPPEIYLNEQQISEVFALFDIKKRGLVSPGDLQAALRSGDADARHYSAMVSEFDHNGDGMLDISEFSSMMKGIPPS